MPIKIPDELPARGTLNQENIFVMPESRALRQDIRALRVAILNLMPLKIVTETQLLRLLGNSPLQVDISLLHPASHTPQNTSQQHLSDFYETFADVQGQKFDGLIVTGAPVEHLEFEEVDYWDELREIMDWSRRNVFSTLYLCWAVQAALFHYYGVPKYPLEEKKFGVFAHHVCRENEKLLRGFDDVFYVPHSRHTAITREDVVTIDELRLLAESERAGVYLLAREDGRQVYVTGHPEYDPLTLKHEYERDRERGLDIDLPANYFPEDDPEQAPLVRWRGHAHLLFSNWLNYCVYQETPYYLEEIG